MIKFDLLILGFYPQERGKHYSIPVSKHSLCVCVCNREINLWKSFDLLLTSNLRPLAPELT